MRAPDVLRLFALAPALACSASCGSSSGTQNPISAVGEPELIYEGRGIHRMVQDEQFLYFLEEYDIEPGPAARRVAKSGGTAETLATFAQAAPDGSTSLKGLAVEGDDLYVLAYVQETGHTLFVLPKTGGTPQPFATRAGRLGPLAHEGYLYWFDEAARRIERVPLTDGSSTEDFLPINFVRDWVVSGGKWYLSTNDEGVGGTTGKIQSLEAETRTLTSLVDGLIMATHLAVGGGYIYWTGSGPGISRGPTTGGQQETFVDEAQTSSLAADDSTLFFGTYQGPGHVKRVPLAGGTPLVIARDQGHPVHLLLDSQFVYWIADDWGAKASIARTGK
jgi:hypothetical protein